MEAEKESNRVFEHMSVPQAVRTMAVPAIIGQLIVLMYNLADTFFIGRTNNPYMVAGVSLILPLFNVALAISSLFGVGGGAWIPKLLARNDRAEASRSMMYCIRMTIFLAFLFSALTAVFMEPLLNLLGAGPATYTFASQYLLFVVVLGGIPTVLTNCLSCLLRSLSLSKQASFGVALGGILNILLDPLFMFVILPKGSEAMGVGIATLLSNVISCAYCMIVLKRGQNEVEFGMRFKGANAESRKAIVSIGLPGTINTLLFDLDYIVLNKLMSGYGDIPLASIGIVLKAERLPLQIGIGLCQAVIPLVAYSYEKKDYGRMKSTIRLTWLMGLGISAVCILCYELFAPYIMQFFIMDTDTVSLGAQFLRSRVPATMFMFCSFYCIHLFQAFGDGKRAFILGVIRWAVFNIPMLFIMRALFGMNGLSWAQLTADSCVAVISAIFVFVAMRKISSSFHQTI